LGRSFPSTNLWLVEYISIGFISSIDVALNSIFQVRRALSVHLKPQAGLMNNTGSHLNTI